MIIAETPSGYQFVTQPDHARLAGQFADHWGGPMFDGPDPSPGVALAAHTHDVGWEAFDLRPRLADDGTPIGFTDLGPETWIDLYDRGIEAVTALDAYAGTLVSMHGSGLRRRRYGLSPSWPPSPPVFTGFIARQESFQRSMVDQLRTAGDARLGEADRHLLEELHDTGRVREATTARLWTNYRLLQAWDSLSLSFCTVATPPADSTLENVPRGWDGSSTSLSLRRTDRAIEFDPYPFDVDPLVLSVPVRTVRRDLFDDEAGLVAAYRAAPYRSRSFEVRSST